MGNEHLKDFYNRDHAYELKQTAIPVISPVAVPVNRWQAAMHYFPRIFKGGDILELGGGSGVVANSLLHTDLPINRYVLTDFSVTRLDPVRRLLDDPRLSVLELDAEAAPESEYGRYDAVIMMALIEHLVDPLGAMRRIRCLLKPGGFVYLDTPNLAKYTRRVKLLFGRFPSTASRNEGLTRFSGAPVELYDNGHLHYFTFRSLERMLTGRCGFSRVVRLPYHEGLRLPGKRLQHLLAQGLPTLFSEIAMIAYR